jgi:hypothetical protein
MCVGKSWKDMEGTTAVTSENVVKPHTFDKKVDVEGLM